MPRWNCLGFALGSVGRESGSGSESLLSAEDRCCCAAWEGSVIFVTVVVVVVCAAIGFDCALVGIFCSGSLMRLWPPPGPMLPPRLEREMACDNEPYEALSVCDGLIYG